MERETATKFYSVLNIFLKVMKLQSFESVGVMKSSQMFKIYSIQLFTMYWNKSLFGSFYSKLIWFVRFGSNIFCYIRSFYTLETLFYDEQKPSCKTIYCSNTTETKRKQEEIWPNIISTGYKINTYKMMLSVVTIFMDIVFKSNYKQNYLGMNRSDEL